MSYCIKCGKEIQEGAAFCIACGAPVEKEIPMVIEEKENSANPIDPVGFNEQLDKEEREFLENTHNLLRWELKAWSISSKVLTILGIILGAFFLIYALVGIIMSAAGVFGGGVLVGVGFTYSIFIGGSCLGLGIVAKKVVEKMPMYVDTVYTDFSLAYNRCGNIGMLVFVALLGVVSPVFFIINFVRMKANRDVIERIMKNQNVQG